MEKKEPLDAGTLDQIIKRVIFTESRQLREGNLRDIAVVKKHVATKYTGKCSYGSLQSTASDGGCYRISYGSGRAALNVVR